MILIELDTNNKPKAFFLMFFIHFSTIISLSVFVSLWSHLGGMICALKCILKCNTPPDYTVVVLLETGKNLKLDKISQLWQQNNICSCWFIKHRCTLISRLSAGLNMFSSCTFAHITVPKFGIRSCPLTWYPTISNHWPDHDHFQVQ